MDTSALCLDTSVLIAYLKGREPGATAVTLAIHTRRCWVTAITVYELLFGVARARKKIGEHELLDVLAVAPFDENAARRAALLHFGLVHLTDFVPDVDDLNCEP